MDQQPKAKEPWWFAVPDYARFTAEGMYPTQQGQDDQQDAARHMLASATLARKYSPAVAEFLGRAHEYQTSPLAALKTLLGLGRMPPDYEPDMHNNALGARIGASASSQAQIEQLVKALADQSVSAKSAGKPWVVPAESAPTKYAHGGLAQVKECTRGR